MTSTHLKPWQKFARDLVTTGEIDPTYYLIHRAGEVKGLEWQVRFAMHYFLFYDLGGAARCANEAGDDFWTYVKDLYTTFPRAPARRHFRGDKGRNAVEKLSTFGPPERVFGLMYRDKYSDLYDNIASNFKGCEVGPYFTWKLMDVFDRCLGLSVRLDTKDALKYLPDVPRKALILYWRDEPRSGLEKVWETVKDLPAPGNPSRLCNYAEAETILCAIYGLNRGSYKFGMDLQHRHMELIDFPDLQELLPPLQLWNNHGHPDHLVPS